MKEIISKGYSIIVDDDVYEWASKISWTIDTSGYTHYARCGKGRLHRMILHASTGVCVDHINGNGLDNRRHNLRICSIAENNRNVSKRKGSTTSRYKGVYWNKRLKKYEAHIKDKGKVYYLGLYSNEEDAAKAYDIEAARRFGDFARMNL